MKLSVIVPVLNDSEALENLAASLSTQKNIEFEVIVVNGGNPDSTESHFSKSICEENRFRYFESQAGRGRQMNIGRLHARAEHFLFLHADSQFSSELQLCDAIAAIQIAEISTPCIAGHFGLQFQTQDRRLRFGLGFLEKKSNLNRKMQQMEIKGF